MACSTVEGGEPIQTILDAIVEALRLVVTFNPVLVEIAGRSLGVTLSALAVSASLGIPVGAWLALSLLNWLKWGWQCLTTNGLWLPPEKKKEKAKALPVKQAPANEEKE